MPLTPEIHTYHCICTSLLFSTTHTLSSLPQRTPQPPSSSSLSDSAIILPIPSSPPSPSLDALLPAEGYTVLLGLTASPASSSQPTIIRREDGFEKRILYRCSRCGVVVGYELQGATANIDAGGADVEMGGTEKGKERGDQEEVYAGKIIYILPAGIMSSRFLAETGRSGKKLAEEDVAIRRGGVGVFE